MFDDWWNPFVLLNQTDWMDPRALISPLATLGPFLERNGFTVPEPVLREQVAKAPANKGRTLGELDGKVAEAIAVYDDLLARFGMATELRCAN